MQLEGTIQTFPLRELIEMITYSSVTGVLEVRSEADLVQIYFYDGRPYHATASELTGIEAVVHLFELPKEASFQFVAGHTVTQETLQIDTWDMLDRAERQAKQWQRVRPILPSLDVVPALLPTTNLNNVQIHVQAWPVLSAINAQRTIKQIAEEIDLELLEVCLILVYLLERKLIGIKKPSSLPKFIEPNNQAAKPTAAPEPKPATSTGSTFFDRILSTAQQQAEQAESNARAHLLDEEPADQQRSNRYVNQRYIKGG